MSNKNLYNILEKKFVESFRERATIFTGFTYRNENDGRLVYPRLIRRDEKEGLWCFYAKRNNKEYISLGDFVDRYLSEDIVGVGGYFEDGKPSSISFFRKDLLKLSSDFIEFLEDLKANKNINLSLDELSDSLATNNIDANEIGTTKFAIVKSNQRKLTLDDLEEKLARQREIGALGEKVAYIYETFRLSNLHCENPEKHISEEYKNNVGAGYDLSSNFNGEKRFIEVKSSVVSNDSFFLSENERVKLSELGEEAYIYLVKIDESDDKNSMVTEEIKNPIADSRLSIEPVAYKVTLKPNN
jgi:hypothetical protein